MSLLAGPVSRKGKQIRHKTHKTGEAAVSPRGRNIWTIVKERHGLVWLSASSVYSGQVLSTCPGARRAGARRTQQESRVKCAQTWKPTLDGTRLQAGLNLTAPDVP